jgi:hypothetical protein
MGREPIRILGTGVELFLAEEADEPPPPPGFPKLPMTPEAHAEEARVRTGEMIQVQARAFVDFEAEGGTHRWGGSTYGRAIDITGDPTLALIGLAQDVAEEAPFGDLRRCDYDVTRWEYYSAPHRLELSAKLRERLPERL